MSDALEIVDKKSVKADLKKHGIKFSKWANKYFDKDSDTYGNATQSVMKVYNVKSYHVAGVIASQNLGKLRSIGVTFDEIEGRGVIHWLNKIATKAGNGSYENMVDYAERMGYLEPKADAPQNQNNFQFNLGTIAAEFSKARRDRGLEGSPAEAIDQTPQ